MTRRIDHDATPERAQADYRRYLDECDVFDVPGKRWGAWWARYGADYIDSGTWWLDDQVPVKDAAGEPAPGEAGTGSPAVPIVPGCAHGSAATLRTPEHPAGSGRPLSAAGLGVVHQHADGVLHLGASATDAQLIAAVRDALDLGCPVKVLGAGLAVLQLSAWSLLIEETFPGVVVRWSLSTGWRGVVVLFVEHPHQRQAGLVCPPAGLVGAHTVVV